MFIAGDATMLGRALVRRLEGQCTLVGRDAALDLLDRASVARLFAETRPEYVILVAGRSAGISGNERYPAELMLDNLLTATHVIDASWRQGVDKLLFLGSSCMYPKLAPQPMSVDSLWAGPVEPTSEAYAIAKLAGLRLCEAYRRQYGSLFITAIQADAFGPGDRFDPNDSHVVAGLVRRLHEAKILGLGGLDIWGTGSPQREFIYVDDVADASVFLMHHYDGAKAINIGTGTPTSIRELAEILRDVVGYNGSLHFDTSRPDGMPLKGLDSSPLRALGWKPAWELKPALQRTYEWFLNSLVSQPSRSC